MQRYSSTRMLTVFGAICLSAMLLFRMMTESATAAAPEEVAPLRVSRIVTLPGPHSAVVSRIEVRSAQGVINSTGDDADRCTRVRPSPMKNVAAPGSSENFSAAICCHAYVGTGGAGTARVAGLSAGETTERSYRAMALSRLLPMTVRNTKPKKTISAARNVLNQVLIVGGILA